MNKQKAREWIVEFTIDGTIDGKSSFYGTYEDAEKAANEYLSALCQDLKPEYDVDYYIKMIYSYND